MTKKFSLKSLKSLKLAKGGGNALLWILILGGGAAAAYWYYTTQMNPNVGHPNPGALTNRGKGMMVAGAPVKSNGPVGRGEAAGYFTNNIEKDYPRISVI